MNISPRTLLIVALLLSAVLFFWATGAHNRLVALRNVVSQAAQRLAEMLAQRAAAHQLLNAALQQPLAAEQGSLAALADALQRSLLASKALAAQPLDAAPTRELVAAEAQVASSAARVMSLLDQHPALRAQDDVQQHLQAWQQAEQRLPLLRQAFNDAAGEHDVALAQFPTRLLARVFRFSAAGRA